MSTQRDWDEEYRSGRWAFLRAPHEAARLGVVAAYLHSHAGVRRVLDIGCGEGHLRHHLDRSRLERYVGVDLAASALSSAAADPIEDRPGRSSFVTAAMEQFTPEGGAVFDGVVVSEVLNLVPAPGEALRRASDWVAHEGVIVVSVYDKRRADGSVSGGVTATWAAIDALGWPTLDETLVQNLGRGLAWRIRALRPQG